MAELTITLNNRGLMIASPHDNVADGFYPNLLNITSFKDGYLEVRQGETLVSPINLGGPVHSQGRIRTNVIGIVNGCPTISPVQSVLYEYTFTAEGGTLPYTWALIAGSLPDGLTLDASSGTIFGTPTIVGDFTYTIQVTDSSIPPAVAIASCLLTVDAAFAYYTPFTILEGQVPSPQADFPVLLVTSVDGAAFARLQTVANGGHVQDPNGYDIRPFADEALTIPLTYELVADTYDATTGLLEMWVKIPILTDGYVIYLAYGNPSLTTDGSSTTTWDSNYSSVYHLQNGLRGSTSVNVSDSTSNANDGTNMGGVGRDGTTEDWSSHMELHITIPATDQHVSVPDAASLRIANNDSATWEVLFKTNMSGNGMLIAKTISSPVSGYRFYVSGGVSTGFINGSLLNDASSNRLDFDSTTNIGDYVWHRAQITYDGSGLNTGFVMRLDGAPETINRSGTISSGNSNSAGPFTIGVDTASGNYYNGWLDEIRVSKGIIRSDDYDTTSYNNQLQILSFYEVGTEVAVVV